MNSEEINLVPEKVRNGMITKREAINGICSFVSKNYRLYGLQKYDEDFRSDLIIRLLEKGPKLLDYYNPEAGCFMKYLYYTINMIIHSKIKVLAKDSIKEKINFEYGIEIEVEKEFMYKKLTYSTLNEPKVPYARKVSNEELITALREISKKPGDKRILVLAMKASFYLTDEKIERISRMYNIPKDILFETIQLCKSSVLNRAKRKSVVEERRNYAYTQHKRFSRMIETLPQDQNEKIIETRIKYTKKKKKYTLRWLEMNHTFEQGYLFLRPSNKFIADMLGICERQVNYYLSCVKKLREPEKAEKAE